MYPHSFIKNQCIVFLYWLYHFVPLECATCHVRRQYHDVFLRLSTSNSIRMCIGGCSDIWYIITGNLMGYDGPFANISSYET